MTPVFSGSCRNDVIWPVKPLQQQQLKCAEAVMNVEDWKSTVVEW